MNTARLNLPRITLFFLFITHVCLFSCEEAKKPANQEIRTPDDESASTIEYQLFNLELATEEAYHSRNIKARGTNNENLPPYLVALKEFRDPCDFKCEPFDIECLLKYIDCGQSLAMLSKSDSDDDDDGDGAEPLPIASDTTIGVFASQLRIIVFSDAPKETQFKLTSSDGKVFASSDISPENFSYNEKKRHAVYKIPVKDLKSLGKSLTIYMNTRITNAAGKYRTISLKHPFGLAFTE